MRYSYLLLIFLTSSISINAQFLNGEITYETKVNLHKNLPDEMAHMKDEIPEFRTNKNTLLFTQGESYYFAKKEEVSGNDDPNPRRRFRRFGGNREEVKLYTDLKTKTSLESREFFGKKFLITGSPNDYQWKFSGKTKQVGSYLCQQAIHQDSTENIEVWFTPMIPVPAGPQNYLGLPGLVLHVDIDEGSRVITAIEVMNKDIKEGTIIQPDEGEEITREAFRELMIVKRKEMEQEYGSRRRMWRPRH